MATEDQLGEAVLLLTAKNQKLIEDMARSKSAATNLQEHFNEVSRGIQTAMEGLGMGFGLHAMIAATVEAENAQAQLAAAVQSTGMAAGFTAGQLVLQSAALQNASTFGDEAIQRMQATMLTFQNIVGDVFVRSEQVILDFATATGRDLPEAARTLGIALNDPVNGLQMLRRAGVSLSESLKENIKDLAESGRITEAQTLLLDELSKAYGGRAAAGVDTLGGALAQLKNRFGDLFLEMGESSGRLTQSIQWLTGYLPTFAAALSGTFGMVKGIVEGLVEDFYHLSRAFIAFATFDIPGMRAALTDLVNGTGIVRGAQEGLVEGWNRVAASMNAVNTEMYTASVNAPIMSSSIQQSTAMSEAAIDQLARTNAAAARKMKADDDKLAADRKRINEQNVEATAETFRLISELGRDANGKMSGEAKAAAIVAATIQAYVAANRALASASPPYNYILAAATFAVGMKNVQEISAMERGGEVTRGQTVLVGEAGPELFTADRSGSIIPNDQLSGRGGGGVVQNFYATGMDFSSAEAARKFFQTGAAMMRSGATELVSFGQALSDSNTINAARAHG